VESWREHRVPLERADSRMAGGHSRNEGRRSPKVGVSAGVGVRSRGRGTPSVGPDPRVRHRSFGGSLDGYDWTVKTFDQLYSELLVVQAERPTGSGTVLLFDEGVHAIGKKIVEEAAEVWMAAEYQSSAETAEEISQLLYHLQVLMVARGITLDDVYATL